MTFDLNILYEEGPCLAVNKPSGLLTQAPHGIDSLEQMVRAYIIEREGRGENGYVGTPHRLDRVASGVILFGKHSRATKRLSEQFEARTIEKTYWVCLEGNVTPDADTWTDYVRKVPNKPLAGPEVWRQTVWLPLSQPCSRHQVGSTATSTSASTYRISGSAPRARS